MKKYFDVFYSDTKTQFKVYPKHEVDKYITKLEDLIDRLKLCANCKNKSWDDDDDTWTCKDNRPCTRSHFQQAYGNSNELTDQWEEQQ